MSLSAQIPNGSQAPPWTATDISGQQHVLYEYLEQGKTVIIEVSATWAGPNYAYHTSGVLQELHDDYGPGGSDELMVFMYETDESTTVADIMGVGNNTMGDWTLVPFPIINDEQILNTYQIAFYPTIFVICPDGIVTEVGQVGLSELYQHAQDCPSIGPLNAAITEYLGAAEACPQQLYNTSVVIQNQNGYDADLTEALIETRVDGVLHQSLSWLGQLSQGESEVVDIAPIPVSSVGFEVEVTIDYSPDVDESDDVVTEQIVLVSPQATAVFQLEIQLDHFPEETKWELWNSDGQIIMQDGPYAGQEDELIENFFVLPYADCFVFKMIDAGGDGLHASASGDYTDGTFQLTDQVGTVIFEGGGDMEWGENGLSKTLLVDLSTGIDSEDQTLFSVYPNPAIKYITVDLIRPEEGAIIRISDLTGQVIREVRCADHIAQYVIPIADLAAGAYILEMGQATKVYSRPFMKGTD